MTLLYAFHVGLLGVAALLVPSATVVPGARYPEVARVLCTVDVRASEAACVSGASAQATLIVGEVRADGDAWTIELEVHNTSALLLGLRPDGAPDPAGIEVHPGTPTTTVGAGRVSVVDAVLRYDGALAPGERSGPRSLRVRVPEGVGAFTVDASVRAEVTSPRGTLVLAPSTVRALSGGTVALEATARAATGARLPTGSVVFRTGDAGVAGVGADGAVTTVGVGATTVTARSGAATASVPIEVCPDLAVGGVFHTTVADGGSVCMSGYGAGAEYTVIPTNQSTVAARTIAVRGLGTVSVTGPPTPRERSDVPREVLLTPRGDAVEGEALADPQVHLEALERDRREVAPFRDAGDRFLVAAPPARAPRVVAARTITPGVPAVGDQWSLNVAPGCEGPLDLRTATVRAVSANAILVTDNSNPSTSHSGGYGTSPLLSFDQIAGRFDAGAWAPVAGAFGASTDVDANGRVVLFYTRAVNEQAPPTMVEVETEGYFASRDLLSTAGCPRSNEGEVLYLPVPDPTGSINGRSVSENRIVGATTRVSGHELQHLINASRRLYVTGAPPEEAWLDEGLSRMAEELMFYQAAAGLAPRQNIVVNNITTGPNASQRVGAFNTYANLNFGRLRVFLQRPDLWRPFGTTTDLANQGALWAFLRYAADRRGGAESAFWAALVDGSATGLANLRQALGLASEAELLTWFRDWNVAMYADDAVAGVAPEYQTLSWNWRSIYPALNGTYQLVPRPLSASPLSLSYAPGGSTSYLRAGVSAGAFGSVRVSLPEAGAPVPVSVLRTK